jgi:RNA ligase
MFRLEGEEAVLVSLPFPKFFNVNENPFTMNLDFSLENVDSIVYKEDGSLITTYIDLNGDLRLKSKTSLDSSMALESMELLPSVVAPFSSRPLIDYCESLEDLGFTVIMEYVSPKNRIVLPYESSNLVVLGVRNRSSGIFMSVEEMSSMGLYPFYTALHVEQEDTEAFVNSISNMTGVEGYVITLKNGTMVKCKSDEYVSLHHAKDSINSPRRLLEVVLLEASDDLKQLFLGDELALKEIENMEEYVSHLVTGLTKPVEHFYKNNEALDRKDFAIKAREELTREQFTLAMSLYSGKEIDYKQFIFKNHKKFLEVYHSTLKIDYE